MKKKSSSVKRKNLKNSIFSPQIRNKKIKKIYKRFEFLIKRKEFKGYLVAVSGGADSLALAYLSKCYQIKNKDNNFHYVHVDHKLRDKSSKEAGTLKKILRKFGIECKIITWKKRQILKKLNQSLEITDLRYSKVFAKQKKLIHYY